MITAKKLEAAIKELGYTALPVENMNGTFEIPEKNNLSHSKLFKDGFFEFQDISSQLVGTFCGVGEDPILFSHFEFPIPEDHYSIELVKQKNNGFALLNELKNFDYLLIVRGERDFFDQEEITNYLNKIPGIQIAISIDIEKIKTKQHLIFN